MNVPNQLTVSRFVLTAGFLIVFFTRYRDADTIALPLFRRSQSEPIISCGSRSQWRVEIISSPIQSGILMDPLADKILVCSAFIAFVERGFMPAWMVVLIVARELAITGLRLLAASKQRVLAAEGYGKHKTISQIVAIISLLVNFSYPEWGGWAMTVFDFWVPAFARVAVWVAVLLTAFSGVLYLWKNRDIYLCDNV